MSDVATPDPTLDFIVDPMQNEDFGIREVALATRAIANIRASLFTVAPGCRTDVDSHAVHELWLVVSGGGQLNYDGNLFRLRPHTVYYFAPFKQHAAINDGVEPLVSYSVWWP